MNKWLSVICAFFIISCNVYASNEAAAGATQDTEGFYSKDNPLHGALVYKNFKGEARRFEDSDFNKLIQLIAFGAAASAEDQKAEASAKVLLDNIDQRYDIEIYQNKSTPSSVYSLCIWKTNESVPFCDVNFLIRYDEKQALGLIQALLKN